MYGSKISVVRLWHIMQDKSFDRINNIKVWILGFDPSFRINDILNN